MNTSEDYKKMDDSHKLAAPIIGRITKVGKWDNIQQLVMLEDEKGKVVISFRSPQDVLTAELHEGKSVEIYSKNMVVKKIPSDKGAQTRINVGGPGIQIVCTFKMSEMMNDAGPEVKAQIHSGNNASSESEYRCVGPNDDFILKLMEERNYIHGLIKDRIHPDMVSKTSEIITSIMITMDRADRAILPPKPRPKRYEKVEVEAPKPQGLPAREEKDEAPELKAEPAENQFRRMYQDYPWYNLKCSSGLLGEVIQDTFKKMALAGWYYDIKITGWAKPPNPAQKEIYDSITQMMRDTKYEFAAEAIAFKIHPLTGLSYDGALALINHTNIGDSLEDAVRMAIKTPTQFVAKYLPAYSK